VLTHVATGNSGVQGCASVLSLDRPSQVLPLLRSDRFEPLRTAEQAAAIRCRPAGPSRAPVLGNDLDEGSSNGPSIYIWVMPRHVRWHRVRVGLVVALIVIFAGVVIDSLFSASWALDDGLLLTAAAGIALALVVTRGRGRYEAR
jgi:hypothetical protein